MDSITQAALGAAVGEAVLGREAGGKAAVWGAFLGTLPDLDILAYPFLDPAQELLFHRGPTHALLFSVVAAPLFGQLLARLHKNVEVGWKAWSWLAFFALITHPILDAFTAYGTQLLLPFSRLPVAFNTISIIDPVYTLPLAAGVLAAVCFRRGARGRAVVNIAGLAISSCYLIFTIGNKLYVAEIFESELVRQRIEYERLEVMPSLFNNVLWIGLAASDNAVFAGLYSHLDEDESVNFRRIPKNVDLLPPGEPADALSVLLWFSRGLYSVSAESGHLVFNDLHVGRTDFYMRDRGESIFSFRLEVEANRVVAFQQMQTGFADRSELLRTLARRITGDKGLSDRPGEPAESIRESGVPSGGMPETMGRE